MKVNPERWREINEVFHAALAREGAARETYLAEAAARDAELVKEVRSLLESHERTHTFLEVPAWGVAPHLMFDSHEATLKGRTIGSYRVTEELGRGGMGVVYAAEDLRLGRMVALKALPPEYTRDAARRERLTREAMAAAALSHPAIATVFALEEIEGDLYIASELVRGRTLREELRDGPLPPERLLETLIDIAAALAAAHAHGIIHRDLKPENVLRRADGQVKILDFVLARFEHGPDAPSVTRLTDVGVALGTPGYISPEQLQGARGDARSDLFSFGVMAWELATGEHPFGTDSAAILTRMTAMMEGRASTLSRPLPLPGLDRITRRCMRGDPGDRYPTADLLLQDLRALRTSSGRSTAMLQVNDAATSLWWWQFHQGTLALLDAAAPALAWMVRRWVGGTPGRGAFFATLALATIAVTLRLNLVFASRVQTAIIIDHRRRLFPWIAASELLIAAILLASAAMISDQHEATAAALLGLAIVTVASLLIIEPTTTRSAGFIARRE